jgi:hypothetical protein
MMLLATALITMVCTGEVFPVGTPSRREPFTTFLIIDLDGKTVTGGMCSNPTCPITRITETELAFNKPPIAGILDRSSGRLIMGMREGGNGDSDYDLICKPAQKMF